MLPCMQLLQSNQALNSASAHCFQVSLAQHVNRYRCGQVKHAHFRCAKYSKCKILFEILKPVEFPKLEQERLPVTLVTWCLGSSPLNIGLNTAVDILREKVEKQ